MVVEVTDTRVWEFYYPEYGIRTPPRDAHSVAARLTSA